MTKDKWFSMFYSLPTCDALQVVYTTSVGNHEQEYRVYREGLRTAAIQFVADNPTCPLSAQELLQRYLQAV